MITDIFDVALNDGVVQRISPAIYRTAIFEHFINLENEAKRLRFGYNITDAGIEKYVDRMTGNQDAENLVFVIFNDELKILALAHFVLTPDGTGELGISVLPEYRGQRLAHRLFSRIILASKVLGVKEIFVQCLAENAAMRHIAKSLDMNVTTDYGESEGRLKIGPPTTSDIIQNALVQQITVYDFAVKSQLSHLKKIEKIIRGEV